MDSTITGQNIDHQLQPYFVDLITFSTLESKWINCQPSDAADGLAQIIQNALGVPLIYVALTDPAQNVDGVAIRIDGQSVNAEEFRYISILLEPYLLANPESSSLIAHPGSRDILSFTSFQNESEGRQAMVAVGSADLTFPNENDDYILALAAKQGLLFLKQIRLLNQLHQTEGNEGAMEERVNEVLVRNIASYQKTSVDTAQNNNRLLAMLESLLVHAPFGFAFFDQDHRYVRINKVLAQMNGLPVEAHYDRTVNEILPMATAQAVDGAIERVFLTGKTVENMEITGETSAIPGQVRHWLTNFYPVRSGGQTIYVGETVIEITERKEAVEALQESNAILRAIYEGTGDGIFLKDRQGHYLMINAAGAGFIGKTIEEMVGKTPLDIFPPDTAKKIMADEQQVMNARRPLTFEDVMTLNGTVSYYHSTKAPYFDAEGNVAGIIGISRDITANKRTEKFNHLLAKAGEILNSSLDYATRLENVAQLAVPSFADWCVVSIGGHKELVHQVAVAHADPDKVAMVRELQQRYPSDPKSQTGAPEVFQTGRSVLYPTITDEMVVAAARDTDHLQILRTLQVTSAMVVPLKARGDTLGVMTFIYAESGRHYTEADVTLAEELGRRAGLAIENARLYSAEHDARRTAERIAKRMTTLQTVTASLSQSLTSDEVAAAVIKQGISALEAASGLLVLLDEDSMMLKILDAFGYPDGMVEKWREFPVSAATPLGETVRTGEPILLETIAALQDRFSEFAKQVQSNHQALVTLPLTREDKIIGAIGLSFLTPQQFQVEDLDFMMALARQCAQALERARLFEVERLARAEAEAAQENLAMLTQERERTRLAQELHDNVAQALGYLNLKLAGAGAALRTGDTGEVEAVLDELKQVVNEVYTDVREEIFSLRSERHAGSNFLELLHRYVEKYQRFYRLNIQLEQKVVDEMLNFPAEVRLQVVRTIQEALMNTRKHAQVNEALIRISLVDEYVQIRVEDRGQGFDIAPSKADKKNSFGLRIMRERMASIGGKLDIFSTVGEGTQTVISVPTRMLGLSHGPAHQDPGNYEE
ncbi:MAG: PAS domain-containing protein [Anaerolineaceae bacterium]|nr:PAS domain-containing protein [Anaerolineaceae bacterium]MCB9098648.1 PAS domain-containing protein [Anaerolineales bacterium]